MYKQSLMATIQEQNLQNFYPPGHPALDQISQRAVQQVAYLCDKWKMPKEIGGDICKLGLYDIWIYIGKWFDSSRNRGQALTQPNR
jgi:hypothetical protein